jgi:hypothetical protein
MIDLLDLGDMGYDVFQNAQLNFWGIRGYDIGYAIFQNTQLRNFQGISGYANSNLKRGTLS